MKTLIKRDLTLMFRQGGGFFVALIFFLSFIVTLPLSIGANLPLLAELAPSFIWLGLLLSTLLGLERLFHDDKMDGTLDLLMMSGKPLYEICLAKATASFIGFGLPLLLATPLFALLLNLPLENLPLLMATLLIGTPCLTLIGMMGAAFAVSFKKGALLMAILILPFALPVLIFGIAAFKAALIGSLINPSFLILCALFLLLVIIAPLFSSLALRASLS